MERESLEMDVVFVGAGPANLSGALHLARLIAEYNAAVEKGERKGEPLGEIQIAVIEKGSSIGAHTLSGAVMDPRGLAELIPDFEAQGAPLESPVIEDHFLYLTKKRAIRSPITPPPPGKISFIEFTFVPSLGAAVARLRAARRPPAPARFCTITVGWPGICLLRNGATRRA